MLRSPARLRLAPHWPPATSAKSVVDPQPRSVERKRIARGARESEPPTRAAEQVRIEQAAGASVIDLAVIRCVEITADDEWEAFFRERVGEFVRQLEPRS